MRIGLIGLGGMGKVIAASLQNDKSASSIEIVGAIVAPEDVLQARQQNKLDLPVLDDFYALLALKPDVIAECAKHTAPSGSMLNTSCRRYRSASPNPTFKQG